MVYSRKHVTDRGISQIRTE